MKSYIAQRNLKTVLTSADVDGCIAGEFGIVLASEGADFLEGRVENLDSAYEKGLRHLQFVHYIRTPVGDIQTVSPVHNGLSEMGKGLVEACNAKGVLIDLAHSTGPAIDQALEITKAPLIWSHGWVDRDGGNWQDQYGYQRRRLSLAHAKKIAARGGVVGLWGLGLSRPGAGWSVSRGDTRAYAKDRRGPCGTGNGHRRRRSQLGREQLWTCAKRRESPRGNETGGFGNRASRVRQLCACSQSRAKTLTSGDKADRAVEP
jgi:hypothetical protein